jgi:hypothetical protein
VIKMAIVGDIYIGGSEGKPENKEIFYSGVTFFLKSNSNITEVYQYDNDWEVELNKKNKCIVARCRISLMPDQILTKGFVICQKVLDLLSVTNKGEMTITAPGDRHAILFCNKGQFVLRYVSLTNYRFKVEVSVTEMDKDGNVKPVPPESKIEWITAFRYYRLSQSCDDLYEAYRNLFLSLESLLNTICVKHKNEGEKQWLMRSLTEVMKKSSFASLIQSRVSDPVSCILTSQYENIRCKIFHAKDASILPHESLNPTDVSEGYELILRLWKHIAKEYFNIPHNDGAVTNYGFKKMLDTTFQNGFTYYLTSDSSVPNKDDKVISPANCPVFACEENTYMSEIKPGRILLTGAASKNTIEKVGIIKRICSAFGSNLMTVEYIEDGIKPIGIDRFENNEIARLVNRSNSKMIFL